MTKILFTMIAILAVLSVSPAQAAPCYTAEEFEAEQGLRIHSELMVIGLTCQKAGGGAGLYNKYRKFTNKNQYLLGIYEDTMMGFFRKNGGDPVKSLHDYRTGLGNDISQKAIRMNVGAFCRHYGGRIDQALAMDHDTLRRWAQKQWPSQPPTRPLCRVY